MKFILISILSTFISHSNQTNLHFELVIQTSKNIYEDFWQIERITNEQNEDVININELYSNTIKLQSSGEYKVIFRSIFGDTIVKSYKLNEKSRSKRVKYPKNHYQEIKLDENFESLINSQNEFHIYKRTFGCWGIHENLWKFKVNNDEVVILFKENIDSDSIGQFKLSKSEFDELISNLFSITKKSKKRWTSTNRDYFYIQFNDKIVKFNSKDYNWNQYSKMKNKIKQRK